jgi:hypothetical protein
MLNAGSKHALRIAGGSSRKEEEEELLSILDYACTLPGGATTPVSCATAGSRLDCYQKLLVCYPLAVSRLPGAAQLYIPAPPASMSDYKAIVTGATGIQVRGLHEPEIVLICHVDPEDHSCPPPLVSEQCQTHTTNPNSARAMVVVTSKSITNRCSRRFDCSVQLT